MFRTFSDLFLWTLEAQPNIPSDSPEVNEAPLFTIFVSLNGIRGAVKDVDPTPVCQRTEPGTGEVLVGKGNAPIMFRDKLIDMSGRRGISASPELSLKEFTLIVITQTPIGFHLSGTGDPAHINLKPLWST